MGAEREVGHTHVCLGCGRSVLNSRRRVRYRTLEASDPMLAVVRSWDSSSSYEDVADNSIICEMCCTRANRQHPNRESNENLLLPVVPLVPQPPPLPPVPEQDRGNIGVEGSIQLPHYRRLPNTSRQCAFEGCVNQSGHLIPSFIKTKLVKHSKLYIPRQCRVCEAHLFGNEWSVLTENTNLLNSFNVAQLEDIIRIAGGGDDFINFENVNEMPDYMCHYWTGLTVAEFYRLYNEISILQTEVHGKTTLAIYLTKLRTGDSDNRLATLYRMSRSCIESRLKKMRDYFMEYFVPNHVGLQHTTREQVAQRNLLIPNNLFGNSNNRSQETPAIVICDGTYIFIQKSSNYLYQKKTYSLHKYDNLVKPFLIVACDGHIIDVSGPYAATQTDAEIMVHLFENENGSMRSFFREDDIFILDRGFRDSIPLLESCGYKVFKPESVNSGERRLTTFQANKSRCVTLCRWVVEVVNGRFKRDFKLFRQDFYNRASLHLMNDFLVAAALINCFHPLIEDRPDARDIVHRALQYLHEPNHLAQIVQESNLNRQRTVFSIIEGDSPQLEDFPRLDLNDLVLIGLGTYHIKQAKSYYAEHVRETGRCEMEVCPNIGNLIEAVRRIGNDPLLIRCKIKSRHIGQRKYISYILYDRRPGNARAIDAILGYCCSCLVGNRTVGCCCHCMTIIWYLGWARHQGDINAPAGFLDNVLLSFEE